MEFRPISAVTIESATEGGEGYHHGEEVTPRRLADEESVEMPEATGETTEPLFGLTAPRRLLAVFVGVVR
ncbi:hypothetical protein [Halorussus lipolyticus]|uniref:hypothetical protein n=1 Tax=Halorussus lipolyticus TaxID=3034024 RepID=UPI0023E8EC3D|nr:hypothetical protein [Halorussus sp. DT80]